MNESSMLLDAMLQNATPEQLELIADEAEFICGHMTPENASHFMKAFHLAEIATASLTSTEIERYQRIMRITASARN